MKRAGRRTSAGVVDMTRFGVCAAVRNGMTIIWRGTHKAMTMSISSYYRPVRFGFQISAFSTGTQGQVSGLPSAQGLSPNPSILKTYILMNAWVRSLTFWLVTFANRPTQWLNKQGGSQAPHHLNPASQVRSSKRNCTYTRYRNRKHAITSNCSQQVKTWLQ